MLEFRTRVPDQLLCDCPPDPSRERGTTEHVFGGPTASALPRPVDATAGRCLGRPRRKLARVGPSRTYGQGQGADGTRHLRPHDRHLRNVRPTDQHELKPANRTPPCPLVKGNAMAYRESNLRLTRGCMSGLARRGRYVSSMSSNRAARSRSAAMKLRPSSPSPRPRRLPDPRR